MPEYIAPGVYIEEIERGRKSVEAFATSTAAFIGETARRPIEPQLIHLKTSCYEYLHYFGDVFAVGKYLPCAIKGFFLTTAVGVAASFVSLVPMRSRGKQHRRIQG